MKTLITTLLACATVTGGALSQTIAVTNGRVVTNTPEGILESGTVLIRDGQIAGVAENLTIPDDATVIDADGGWITPGLFHPYTQLGLSEVGAETSTHDMSADESEFSVSLDISEGFYPSSRHIQEAKIDGITRFAVFPSLGQTIVSGTGGVADSTGGANSFFATDQFTYINLGRSGGNLAGGSKPAAWAYLRAAMEDARAYPGRYLNSMDGLVLNRTDAEAFLPVIRGNRLLVIGVDSEMDIRRVIEFKSDNPNLQIAIYGGREAHVIADEVAASGIPVIADPMPNLPSSFDTLQSSLSSVTRLIEAGVDVSISSSGSSSGTGLNARLLPQHAGTAVAYGTDWQAAFDAITINPATLYGMGDTYGALATGYAGDVVVWDGDPLEVMSAPTAVVIDGQIQDMETRQTRLRDRYSEIRSEIEYAYH